MTYFFIYVSTERACSLNNCTIAKRIGKGKDATVIFEHFRKSVDPFVQENCPCKALNSEMGPPSSDTSNSYGNVQNGNNFVLESYNKQMENSSELRDASQAYTHNSGFSFIPTDNTASGNGDVFSVTYLRSILSSISSAFPSHNNAVSSTVITSKLIKDPRLMKREQSMRNQSNTASLSDVLPFGKSLGPGDSQIKLTCMPTNSISSCEVRADHTISSCLDASCFKFSSERSHYQTPSIGSKGCECLTSKRIAITEQLKEQHSPSFPRSLSNALSDGGKQEYSEERVQKPQMRSNIPVLTALSNEPQNSYESENTCSKDSEGHVSEESQSSNTNTICKAGHQMSTVFPVQKEGNLCEYIQETGMMRTFISPEVSSKDGVNQTWCKETVYTNETISSPIDISNTLYQEHKEGGNLYSLSGNCEKIAVTHNLQMPKLPMSATGDKNELDHAASELECYLIPNIECPSQKSPQHSLEHEDNINTKFAVAQRPTELKTVQDNRNFGNILSDAFQEAKDVPLAREKLMDRGISSSAIVCVQRGNENVAVSPYDCHKEEAPHINDDVQNHSLSYDAELSCDLNLKINLQEQKEDENLNEAKERDSAALSPEHNTDNINGSKKPDFHVNDLFTDTVAMREIKNNTKVEILNSEECFTLHSFWGKKGKPAEMASSESEVVEQRHAPNDGRDLEHLVSTFPETEGSSVCVASNTTKQVVGTTVLTVSTNLGDHQKDQLKEICSSESSDWGLMNENSALKAYGLGSEIEIELEECDDASLFQQNTHSHENDLCEEFDIYESLKSRIDWQGLFGSSYEEMETSSFARREEGTDQHRSTDCNCVSFCSQKDKRELHNPIFLPDLQVTITNLHCLRISPTDESLELKDNFYQHITKSTEPDTNKEGNVSGFSICSQSSGENSSFSCENKFSNSMQESGNANKSGISHSSNSSRNTPVDQGSGKPNSNSLSTKASSVTVMNDKSKYPTKSKPDFNHTRNKKDMQSRSSKRNLHASSRGRNVAHKNLREHETHGKRRKPASHDSSDRFSSLSQGRIKTFSQSERHIRNVLNVLNSEASLCKSRHLSRKLNKAVLHLKKAHRRVHSSLQLISKVGQKRKGPLPRAYAIIHNNFWESCDLQGDSLMSERRYSKHVLSKRKYDKQGEKRFVRFDIEESLTPVSKHRSYRTNRERVAECLSSEIMSGHASSSLTTFHVREFCDEEQLPESQLPLAYTSQSISQLEHTNSVVGNAGSSELEHFSETSGNMLDPEETLTEKEYQTDTQLCSSDSAKLESHSTHSIRAIAKEYSAEDKTGVCESSSVSCFIKENTSHSPDNSYDATCKANTDIHISVSDSNKNHILSVDIYEQDNCVSDGAKSGEAIFPIEKCSVPMETTSSMPAENLASRSYTIPLVSSILMTAGEEESSVGENGLFDINENEMNITKHSKLDLTSVTEESNSCKKNMSELCCNDSSVLLKKNITGPSKRYMAKYIEEEKIRKIEQAVYRKIITEGSAISFKYKSQNKILKEESFHVKKIITNYLTDSHLSIKNPTVDTVALKDVPNQLKERKEGGQIKVSNNSHSDCLSKPAIAESNHRPALCEDSKVAVLEKELKEHHSANYTSHVTELSQILQRADEAASLQILEEETKLCQNILPLFVEAFERQQECSVDQILISRKLLVEQNLWNNCRLKLKPCAVDAWVELQMAMETIQFIENKKRFLEGKPTFRSLLWYDESLYSELLHRPRGYQLQSNFYPGFQGRLKYNAFCELQNYHNQLIEFLTETKKENNSYYAFLKYKRQINECEAIMKHYSDCFDFCLSVPFTCGVNFGDSLGDLETLRKSTLKLISVHGGSPKVHSYPGKNDHLWIIIEIVSSKVSFIKSNEEISIKICLYGLEHIYFDAAKSLVWKEKSCSLLKAHSEKSREMEEINECAFSKLEKIYGVLSESLNKEPTGMGLEEDAAIASTQSALGSIPNCRLNKAWLSYPDISCVGDILDQAKSADVEKLQDLTLRCTDHLEILKKYFQMLQEDNIDNIFIMEENVLDMLNDRNTGAVILKPEAIEIYIEIVMISETIHYLKNSIAKKLHNQRFRGMLWFDWSLLPELIGCQEEVASFSVGDNQTHGLWKLIETAISVLKKELAIIYEYGEASNCSYALHLFYRELKELMGVKRLLNNSKYSVSTYIDLVPHTASVNFGNTVAELEQNYKQFFLLLKNVMSVPQKDFGKMVHIMKVMKTIEHMKVLNAKDTKLSTHLLFLQMLRNRRNALQQNRKEMMETPVTEPEEDSSQPGVSEQTAPAAECTIKSISGSSKKRPVTTDTCEVSQEKGNTDAVSSWKKQKVQMFQSEYCKYS